MKTYLFTSVLAGAALFAISDIWAAEEVAFVNGAQVGNQSQGPVNLGLEFTVHAPIFVNEIGAFDSGGGGFAGLASGSNIQVVIFNSATRAQVPGTLTTFTKADPGVLTYGSRFKAIAPVVLEPGTYVVDAFGYGEPRATGQPNGNTSRGPLVTSFNGAGVLSFSGSAPWNTYSFLTFPGNASTNVSQPRFAAGTFGFEAVSQPAFTQSQSFACNQEVCNGLPLDQGGQWQFIEANAAFSLYHKDASGNIIFGMYGNPGNPGTGGISNVQDQIPEPPYYLNGASGGEGQLTFTYSAVDYTNKSTHYNGHVVVQGHEVRHCFIHGCWDQMIVDNAQIYIDSVTQD